MKSGFTKNTSIPVHLYICVLKVYQSTCIPVTPAKRQCTSPPVHQLLKEKSIPVHLYTSHKVTKKIPVTVISTLPLLMFTPFESTPLAAVVFGSSPLAAVVYDSSPLAALSSWTTFVPFAWCKTGPQGPPPYCLV